LAVCTGLKFGTVGGVYCA